MAGAITIKQLIEQVFVEEVKIAASKAVDPIDVLNSRLLYSNTETYVRQIPIDNSTVTRVDKYGDVTGTPGGEEASYADRAYADDVFTIPYSNVLRFSIPFDRLHEFGLTREMLESPANELSAADFTAISEKMREEFTKLIRKILLNRRNEMVSALKLLQAGDHGARKPLGVEIVAEASSRPTYWNYTNQLSTALDEDSYKTCVDIFASGQKTVDNASYGASRIQMILHASSYTLAEAIHIPNLSVNELHRTPGGSLDTKEAIIPAVGVYGDSDNPDEWIALGVNHEIYRLAMKDPFNGETNGIVARMYVNVDNGKVVFEVRDRSLVMINSPVDIVKAVIPGE